VTVTDPRWGRRRAAGLFAAATAGCIATNPRWDGPDDAGDDAASTNDADADIESTSDGLTDGDEASSSGAESSWTGSGDASSSGDSTPSGDEDPPCDDGKISCAGECKDTSKDRHACGPACLDCTVELDSDDAVCEESECRTDKSGDDDD
jgi:hypothetical protein